ncbi:MAG: SDR family NAD(P)-dependent oxidoreductase [Lachnospira pectinoschiza]
MKKTIVITGASRGIGKAIAIELAGKDTNIVINCVNNVDKLNEVKSIIEEKGSVCETFIGDMGNYSDVQKMFDMCLQRFGQVDVLINNAGISVVGLFQDMGENEWHRICNTNIDSVFNCCHFAVKDMMKRHCGKIINISSVWGLYGASCEVAYSATKGAVNSFTKALAKNCSKWYSGQRCCLRAIDTEMNGHLSDDDKASLAEEIPAGRFGSPQEVAKLVKSLSGMNSYLTGQIITLDGGWI